MDIMTYMDQVYRWMQQFYTPERLESPVARLMAWLEGTDLQRGGIILLWTVILAVVIDLVLYWTRTDQIGLIRRLWYGAVKLWQRLTVKPGSDTAKE